jgi:hypothetical protein
LFLSGGVIFDLAATAVLFNAADSSIGLAFYFLFIAFFVGIAVAIKKRR